MHCINVFMCDITDVSCEQDWTNGYADVNRKRLTKYCIQKEDTCPQVACNSYVASTFTLKSNSFTVYGFTRNMTGYVEIAYFFIYTFQIIIIIKLYCHIQHTLYDELECSLALTHIVPIYTIK